MDKLIPSLEAGALFGLLSTHTAYRLTDSLGEKVGVDTSASDGCPTSLGVLIHAIAYTLIVKALMMFEPTMHAQFQGDWMTWRPALMGGALFVVLGHPMTFSLTQKLLGGLVKVADVEGCATTPGLLVHSGVFALLTYLSMVFKL